ncbi:MAG: serine/threonine protein kinase [Deltaproteobacteria bacterium]|nr:serine/threonine protein kinase [Deltaproteobacteria bacterium]
MSRGQTFHRYRLLRRIARGGMAEVFLAQLRGPSGFEKRVALKKILPVYAGMEEFGILFRDEARLSGLLEHSAIVQTYEFGQTDGELFMAMEYVDGPDLEDLLDRCRRRGILLPVEIVLHIVHELTRALEYAHSLADPKGRALAIIHRDVSPPNVLIGVHGEIKLTDFGVAKTADRQSQTRPGVLRGKYAYMSPEQVQQGEMDHRSDIFSVGIVLYEALTGVNPFEGTTDFQTMESVERAEVEPAGFLRPDTPTELDRVLLACLESDPDLRYQSASDLRRDLGEVIRSLGAPEGPEALVQFLKDVFPERAPDAAPSAADLGAPPWEHFAHRLAAMAIPMPTVGRDLAKPSTEGRLVMGDADPGSETTNEPVPVRRKDPRSPELKDTLSDEEPAATGPEPGPRTAAPALPAYNEWVHEDDNPDRIHTQPGVLMRAVAQPEEPGPTSPGRNEEPLPSPTHEPVPVRGLDEVPDQVLDGVEDRTAEGIPVFNEWDFEDEKIRNLAHDTSLDLDDHPKVGAASVQPRRTVTQASGVSMRKVMGVDLDESKVTDAPLPAPKGPAAPPRARLRPPGRPRLHPVSRPQVEGLSPPVQPLDLSGSHSLPPEVATRSPGPGNTPTEPLAAPSTHPQLSVMQDREDPDSATKIADADLDVVDVEPATRRPMWANAVWAAAAMLIPLGALSSVNWLDTLQREASTPRVTRPVTQAPETVPLPERRIEAMPPTRPGETPSAAPADDSNNENTQ